MLLQNEKLYEKAKELYKNRQFKDALDIFEKINQNQPGNDYIEFMIAKIKTRDNKTIKEAKELFLKLMKNSTEYSSNSLFELGKIEFTDRNYNKARAYFNKLIKRENDVLAYIQLSKIEMKLGDYDKAIQILENLDLNEKKNKFDDLILFQLVIANRRKGDTDKAIEYLRKLEKIEQRKFDYEWIMFEWSKIEQISNNFDAAIKILYKLLNTKVKDAALEELVKIYINQEQYDLAYKFNNEILKLKVYKSRYNVANINAFLKYKLGIENDNNVKNIYFIKQLYSYNKEEVLNHISQHLDENEEKFTHSVYCEDINIEQLYDYALEKINNLEPIEESMNDKYIIRYNRIVGMSIDNQPTDTIKIVVIPNTKNIITIYPVPAINNKVEMKNNYTSSKQKVKESQIDKFKRRYNKK